MQGTLVLMTIIVIKVVAVVLITGWLIPWRVEQAETSRVFTCWNVTEILDHNTIVVTTIVMITILLIITVIKIE